MKVMYTVGIAMVLAMVSAFSLALNALNINPSIPWSWIAFISFVLFMVIVGRGWYDAETRARRLENARPHVMFDELSPATSLVTNASPRGAVVVGTGRFMRLVFVNNTADPKGDIHTAHAMTASIKVVDSSGQTVDAWDGRWANSDAPKTTGDVWLLNRIDLPANNQKATLDIGLRLEGELAFHRWDNAGLLGMGSARTPIQPGQYHLLVTVAAANMQPMDFVFRLTIPNEPQSEQCWPEIDLA